MIELPLADRAVPVAEAEPRLLFVPVDSSPACERTIAMATTIAMRHRSLVVLVGVEPGTAPYTCPDPEEVQALLQAAEHGLVTALPPAVEDAEERVARLLWHVLLPVQLRLRDAGIESQVRVLRGHDPALELREVLVGSPHGSALALGNPLTLGDPLRDLTRALLVRPPCTLYVAGLAPHDNPRRWRILSWMLGKTWVHPAC
jgi:hypothetical protein